MRKRLQWLWQKGRKPALVVFLVLFVWWLFCLPKPLFRAPLATELLSSDGELLSARIAADGQWRMPAADSVSPKLIAAVINYEDKTFRSHWGISARGFVRALLDNWSAGRVVSGGSTLTMQVARMARGNKARTLVQKVLEATVATRLEAGYSKDEILRLWLANAPFGGNVVGAEAAARRYYGRSPAALSWAEAATLAVLPNSPALIHPGRSREELRFKRNRLLDDLARSEEISSAEAGLAKLEPLPDDPHPLPRAGEHLLERLRQAHGPGRYRSSLHAGLQTEITELVRRHQSLLAGNQVHNTAAMVTEVATGKVVAYVGNSPDLAPAFAPDVDIITAPRSPGSLLKPMLYALAQEDGKLTPRGLLADIPTRFDNFQPANFYQNYDGAIRANEALARSLNIPFVYLLQDYGVPRFHAVMRDYGFEQINQPSGHYGLSLILGGGEITMEEINGWFLGMARQLRYFYDRQGQYQSSDFDRPTLLDSRTRPPLQELSPTPGAIGAGSAYLTFEALTELTRPDDTGAARRFTSRRRIAWKTGTSFGFRDAWAVGSTPAYVVSVWSGNADGEGREGLVGVRAAAPLMFNIFRALEEHSTEAPAWFEPPWDDMVETTICSVSGHLAGPDCPPEDQWVASNSERSKVCPHHKKIFTNEAATFRVRLDCGPTPATPHNWFVLPARQAFYYRQQHPEYQPMPPLHPDCGSGHEVAQSPMQFIYPYKNGVLSPVKNWKGETEPIFFELAHQDKETTVFWHLDGNYLGETTLFHSLTVDVEKGRHLLTVVDKAGNRLERRFTVN
ncbi:penicillin-binding protein 1C [Neolewinella aurantiaca]|uniref:penicillin-binding protein 1C n=1 Tax=Neolewinella aurantiaca TaxID=2602767 RepID=UPI0016507E92|nr:penicillin-binding protein 1C [Neolewinella aurantiaca]